MNWDKIKELAGVIVATSAVILTVGSFLLNVWIKDAVKDTVEAELAKLSFPSDATIAEVSGKINVNSTRIDGVQNRQEFTEQQLLDMASILRRRPDAQ